MLQIGGLASGLDTQTLIDQLMQVESRPLTLWKQQQQQLQDRAAAWKDIQARLSSLQSRIEDLTDLTLFRQRAASSSNEQVVTATAAAAATPVSLSVEVAQLATVHRLAGVHVTDPATWTVGVSGTLSATVGGNTKTAAIVSTDSLAAIRDKLNGLGLDLKATLINDTLVVEGTKTGVSQSLSFSDDQGGTLLGSLGLTNGGTLLQAPQDAMLKVNGLEITSATNSVAMASDGLTLNLTGVGKAQVDVKTDTDEIVRRVKAFVDQYNSTFSLMQDKSGKGSLLQGDVGLIQLMSNLRWQTMAAADGSVPTGQISMLAQLGVAVDRSGAMSVDESKLRQQLTDRPEAVQLLLQANPATDGWTGVMRRLSSYVDTALNPVSGVTTSSQKAAQSRIDDLDRQMEAFQRRLDQRRDSLVRQFSALEQVISTLQSQSNWLAGQLKQLGGGTSK